MAITYNSPHDRLLRDWLANAARREDVHYRFLKTQPCPLLGADDRCTVYAVRPECCRSYPNTDKAGFATRTYQHASNSTICPAVYHIVERMRRQSGRLNP